MSTSMVTAPQQLTALHIRILRECASGRAEQRLITKLASDGNAVRDVQRAIDHLLHGRMLELRDRNDSGSAQGRPRSCWTQCLYTTSAGKSALAAEKGVAS